MGQETRFVGSIPRHYDQGLGPVLFDAYAEMMALRAAVYPVTEVLETAAGTGIMTRRLRDTLPASARLVATDLNADMLAVARAKFRPDESVVLHEADAMDLPYADGAFDAVVCQFGLMFFPNQIKAHREARRVLKTGGHYYCSVWDSMDANPYARRVSEMLNRVFPNDPPSFLNIPFGFHAIDPIRSALHDAGFGEVAIEVLPRQTVFDRSFAEGVALGSPLADQIRARNVDPASLVDEIDALLEKDFASRAMPLRAIFFRAEAV